MTVRGEGESGHGVETGIGEDGTVDGLQSSDNELVEHDDRFAWVGEKVRSVIERRVS